MVDLPDAEAPTATAGLWLGIETSGLHGSVALARVDEAGCRITAAYRLGSDRRSARTLAPGIADLLAVRGVAPAEIAAIAVAVGPGSFTGLRVGVVTAKTMAYATGAAPIGVDTLDALAIETETPDRSGALWAVLDAQRGELFCAGYARAQSAWRRTQENERLTREQLLQRLAPDDLVVGPIADSVDHPQALVREPSASGVLRFAWRRWLAGEGDDAFALAPRYHRPSAAEEKADQERSPSADAPQ